jgi:hypothetical protein
MDNSKFTEDFSIPVLVDAKTEYTKQLIQILRPHLYEGIQSIYENGKIICNNNEDENLLLTFQNLLSNIPKWSQEIIETECNRIIESSSCDWLEELVTAVILSHTKILTSIRSNKTHKKIKLNIPKIDHFIHKIYIELARSFWKKPYLFNDKLSSIDIQRNMGIGEEIINQCISETIRKQLPVKSILKEYLGNEFNDQEDTDIVSSLSEIQEENLRKLVKKEIDNYQNGGTIIENNNNSETIDNFEGKIEITKGENNAKEVNTVKEDDTDKEDIAKEVNTEKKEDNVKEVNTVEEDNAKEENTVEENTVEENTVEENTVEENNAKKVNMVKKEDIVKEEKAEINITSEKNDFVEKTKVHDSNNLLETNSNNLLETNSNNLLETNSNNLLETNSNNLLENKPLDIVKLELPVEYVDYGISSEPYKSEDINDKQISKEVLDEFNSLNTTQKNEDSEGFKNLNFFDDAEINENQLVL